MSKILIRGYNSAMTISADYARKADLIKKDAKIPNDYYLSFGDFGCHKGDIRAIVVNDADDNSQASRDYQKEDNEKYRKSVEEDFAKRIKWLCNMPISDKSKIMLIPRMLWQAYTGEKNPPEEFLSEIEKRQFEHFREFPHRPYAHPSCYRDLLEAKEGIASPYSDTTRTCRKLLVDKVGDIIQESYKEAKRLSFKVY